jgi:chromosome segregation ATPase
MPALAFKDEYDEVPVSTPDDPGVAALRDDLKDLKAEFRAMAVKAAHDLKEMWDRIDRQFAYFREDMREMRADTKQLRERFEGSYDALNRKIDGNHETLNKKIDSGQEALNKKIDANQETLNSKIDANFDTLSAKIDTVSQQLGHLSSKVDHFGSRFSTLRWICSGIGGLGGLIAAVATVGSALHWF